MNESHKQVFEKLEEAVEQLGATVSGAQQGLAEDLTRARSRFEAASAELSNAARLPAELQELRQEMEALRTALGQQSTATPAPPQAGQAEVCTAIESLRAEVRGLRQDVSALSARLDRMASSAHPSAPEPEPGTAPQEHEPAGEWASETWQEVARLRAQLEDDAIVEEAPGIENLAYDSEGHRRRIGEILLTAGLIEPLQIDQAIEVQASAPYRRLGSILVERGFAPEEVVARVLAGQLRTRFVRLTKEPIDPAAIGLLNARMARQRTCIPIAVTDERITLAIANPFDLVTVDDVELTTERQVDIVVATASDIAAAVARHYPE